MTVNTSISSGRAGDSKLAAIFTKPIRDINYQSPDHSDERSALGTAMLDYAHASGAPYKSHFAQRYFNVGLPLTCAYYPTHPFAVKLHIAIYSWLAIYIDDDEDGNHELAGFQARFQKGETQPSALLSCFATNLQEMAAYFEPLTANFIVSSSLQFINATLLERRVEFQLLQHSRDASRWPDYVRDRSGVPEAFAYFNFPKDQCPDIGAYIQGIPDMMTYINYANDILSFHKETLASETDNYINTRAICEHRDPLAVLEIVLSETITANSRVVALLRTRSDPVYLRKWNEFFNGYIHFHVTAERYKLHEYPELAHSGVSGKQKDGMLITIH